MFRIIVIVDRTVFRTIGVLDRTLFRTVVILDPTVFKTIVILDWIVQGCSNTRSDSVQNHINTKLDCSELR